MGHPLAFELDSQLFAQGIVSVFEQHRLKEMKRKRFPPRQLLLKCHTHRLALTYPHTLVRVSQGKSPYIHTLSLIRALTILRNAGCCPVIHQNLLPKMVVYLLFLSGELAQAMEFVRGQQVRFSTNVDRDQSYGNFRNNQAKLEKGYLIKRIK